MSGRQTSSAGRVMPVGAGDSRFWTFFGGIWLLVGVGFAGAALGALLFADPAKLEDPELVWVFLAVGLVLGAAGAFIIRRARATAARDQRLMRSGIQLSGVVIDVRRSAVDINRQPRWHVRYRYEYTAGQPLEGESRALPSHVVEGFRPGDRLQIRVEPGRPTESLLVGKASSREE